MSDFLTRLAERTLGLVPVAQPIIAPMFAPNTLNDIPQGLVQSNGSQGALVKTQASPAQETSPVFSKSDLMIEAKFPEMMTERNDNDIFKPISKSLDSKGLPKSKHSKANISDRNEPDEPSTDVVISEQNQRNIQEPEHSLNAQKDVSGPRIVLDELSTRYIPAVPEAHHAETFTSMPYAHRKFRSQNVTAPASSSSTPTIQVTIGRIEVRAITPPVAPAQRSRTPSPTLSLDDYLKQRNGGQR